MATTVRKPNNTQQIKEVQAILVTLDRINDGFGTRNFELLSSAFSQSADTIFVGSESGKAAEGGAAVNNLLRRVCAASHAYSWSWDQYRVTVNGDTARVFAEGTEHVRGSHVADNPYRLTAVFEREGGDWRCVHYHGAEPVTSVEQAQIAS
jgi:ketosteroid isomerase-like protein